MMYTVWSRGEHIGESELGFRSLGFDQCRSGHFLPNARGRELMDELASDSHCMRAFMHRDYRDDEGNGLLAPEYVGSDWFGDVAAHLHETAEYALELRDANNALLPTTAIGIQDKEPSWPSEFADDGEAPLPDQASPPNTPLLPENSLLPDTVVQLDHPLIRELNEHHKEPLPPYEAQLLREKLEAQLAQEAQEELDDIAFNESICMPGHETQYIPLDITRPVGWEYAESQGDDELGSGWNATLRDIPNFPRYQLHVILAPG